MRLRAIVYTLSCQPLNGEIPNTMKKVVEKRNEVRLKQPLVLDTCSVIAMIFFLL